jgi:hypothetical protein
MTSREACQLEYQKGLSVETVFKFVSSGLYESPCSSVWASASRGSESIQAAEQCCSSSSAELEATTRPSKSASQPPRIPRGPGTLSRVIKLQTGIPKTGRRVVSLDAAAPVPCSAALTGLGCRDGPVAPIIASGMGDKKTGPVTVPDGVT